MMTESMQSIMRKNDVLAGMQTDWTNPDSNTDNTNLLPTDDQLDQLVDSLCDNFPSMKIQFDYERNSTSSDSQDLTDSSSPDSLKSSEINAGSLLLTPPSQGNRGTPDNVETASSASLSASFSENKQIKISNEKRVPPSCNLKMSIARCQRNLERLAEKRKSLEMQVQLQNNVFSTARLPEVPTKVDRLMFEVYQERSKVVGLLAALDKTVKAFGATSTKDDLRQLLERYRVAIVNVIKERHNEIEAARSGANSDASNRASKLAELIDKVNLLTRETDTALWCVNVKHQVLMVKSRKCFPKSTPEQSVEEPAKTTPTSIMPPYQRTSSMALLKMSLDSEAVTRRSFRTPQLPKMMAGMGNSNDGGSDSGGESQKKPRGGQYSTMLMGVQQHTNIYQWVPSSTSSGSSPKMKKSPTLQLYAQQQRAEIFQRYSSALKNNRNGSNIK